MKDKYEVWKASISGDSTKVKSGISKEEADKLVEKLNKKANWTECYIAVL